MREQDLVNQILHYLILKGHFVWRNNTGMTRASYTDKFGNTKNRVWRAGKKGSSDIIGIAKDGKFIAVECKIKPNKTTPSQEEFLVSISRLGGYSIVAYSLEDVSSKL